MAKCVRCNNSGFNLKVDISGFCPKCQEAIRSVTQTELNILRKFHNEYSQIPDARAEADRILSEARANADAIMAEVYATKERLEKEMSDMRSAAERDIRLAQLQSEEKLARLKNSTSTTVASVEALLAGLLASASKEFSNLSESTASKAFYSDQKRHVSSGHPSEPFAPLTPAAFKRAANKGYVVFDLETTGLNRTSDRIIEIGAIKYDGDGQEIDRYSTLVNPGIPIPAAASEVNNITDDMVANAPFVYEVLPSFFEFVDAYPVIAHNAGFDIGFLQSAVNKYQFIVHIQYADSLAMAKKKYELSSYRLGVIARYLRIPESTAHRSIGDCEMLGAIVADLLKP